ncbi:MAG: hypothetical protein J2P41_00670 [Blastocatellia bacterium]|nr:hypothetical protein [Blastocatellia bacterium]
MKLQTKRCASCGRLIPSGRPPRPLKIETRLRRVVTSVKRILALVADQRGAPTARRAAAEIREALEKVTGKSH